MYIGLRHARNVLVRVSALLEIRLNVKLMFTIEVIIKDENYFATHLNKGCVWWGSAYETSLRCA